ncbi:hypothetical protein [Streptomyces phaeochromogenes]|uniref:hypothetical protein n=1 Tax=Streptomyces phaeochromogenes TaxID=1923 RepID=UPI002DDB1FD1|nr:hypothetical protein [Streptomyces phaeochromogenes]WRZ31363.1 hypothetical protein OG931_28265 [Streptomyces phaeochromogenes]
MVLADDANDVTRETYNSVVDPDILRFAMVKNDRDMRKILTRLVEENVLERVTVGGNGRAAKYRFRYLVPAAPTTDAGPKQTGSDTSAPDVAGPKRTSNSGVAGPNETANSDGEPGAGGPKRTGYSGVAGPNRNSCRSNLDLPTPSTSSTTTSTTSAAAAEESDSPGETLFDETPPAAPKRRATASSEPTDPDAFEAFWTAYPRRVGKKAAIRSWNTALKAGIPAARIVQAAEAYRRERNGEPDQYTKHPRTWLHGGHYDDEPTMPGTGRTTHRGYANPDDHDVYDEDMF